MECAFSIILFCYNFRAMRRDARAVAEWDFDRIIPCHGVSYGAKYAECRIIDTNQHTRTPLKQMEKTRG